MSDGWGVAMAASVMLVFARFIILLQGNDGVLALVNTGIAIVLLMVSVIGWARR